MVFLHDLLCFSLKEKKVFCSFWCRIFFEHKLGFLTFYETWKYLKNSDPITENLISHAWTPMGLSTVGICWVRPQKNSVTSPVLGRWAGSLVFCWRSVNNGKVFGLYRNGILKAVNMQKIPVSKKVCERKS